MKSSKRSLGMLKGLIAATASVQKTIDYEVMRGWGGWMSILLRRERLNHFVFENVFFYVVSKYKTKCGAKTLIVDNRYFKGCD